MRLDPGAFLRGDGEEEGCLCLIRTGLRQSAADVSFDPGVCLRDQSSELTRRDLCREELIPVGSRKRVPCAA